MCYFVINRLQLPTLWLCSSHPATTAVISEITFCCSVLYLMLQFWFPDYPISYNCHICHTQQVTRTSHEIGLLTWLIVGTLCLFLLPFGLFPFALIPLCIPGTMDVVHTCPNCNNRVGTYRRLQLE